MTPGAEPHLVAADAGVDVGARAPVRNAGELEQTLLRLMPSVRRWLYRMLGPAAALDDAVQDALIEIAQALPRFEGRSSVEGFARTISVRVAYRYFQRRESAPFDPELHAGSEPLPDRQLAERRGLLRLHRCLAKLSPKRRTAFVLCAIEELSPHEAAALVGTSAGSMRARYMHARAELARYLDAERGEGRDG